MPPSAYAFADVFAIGININFDTEASRLNQRLPG
jgi:hypothetical protein